MKLRSASLSVTSKRRPFTMNSTVLRVKPLAIAVLTTLAVNSYAADNTAESVSTEISPASSTMISVETAEYVNDSQLLTRAQEKIDADSRVIDAMSLRIKEMIRARHNIEAINLQNKRIIEQLKLQLAGLRKERDEAGDKHKLLLSEKDDLLRRMEALRDKNSTDRERIASLNGVAKQQEGIIASLENGLGNARSDLQSKHANIAELEQKLADLASDHQQARADIDKLNASLVSANQAGGNLALEKDRLAGEINRLQGQASQSLAAERDAHAATRNTLADTERKLAGVQERLADLQETHIALDTEKAALQATADGLDTQLRHLQAELDNRVTEIQAANSDFVNLREKINNKEAELIRANGEIADATQKVDALENQIAMLSKDRDNTIARNNALQSDIDDLQADLAERTSEYAKLKNTYQADQSEKAAKIASLNKELNTLKNRIASATADQLALQRQYDNSLKSINSLNAALTRNSDKQDEIASQKQQLLGDMQGLNTQNSALKDKLAALTKRNGSLLEERNALGAEKKELANNNELLLSQYESQAGKLQALVGVRDELAAERDKLAAARDKLTAERDALKNQRASLADNLQGVTAERDTLQAALSSLTAERDSLATERNELSVRAKELTTERQTLGAEVETVSAASRDLREDNLRLIAASRNQADTIRKLNKKLFDLKAKTDAANAKLAGNQQDSLDKIRQLELALAESRQQLTNSNGRLNALMQENEKIDNERSQLAANAESLRQQLEDELAAAELNFVTVQKAREDSSVPLRLGSADFFATGSAELTAKGRENLKKLTDIITKFEDRRIVVAGHTDSKKIGQRLKPRYFSNWELSVARAAAAVRFMQGESTIDPTNISAAGYSEYSPIADNATREGRQMNRRVEVVLYPRVVKEKLYSELDD